MLYVFSLAMQILVNSLQDMVLHYPETMWRLYVTNGEKKNF